MSSVVLLPPGLGLVITLSHIPHQNLFIINRFDPRNSLLLPWLLSYSSNRKYSVSEKTSLGQQDNILTFEFASWYFGTPRVLRINWFWPEVGSVKTSELEFWLQWKLLRWGMSSKNMRLLIIRYLFYSVPPPLSGLGLPVTALWLGFINVQHWRSDRYCPVRYDLPHYTF